MKVTVLAALMVFAAYFLLLYAGVGFLQDKRFFGSAPKENLDAIPDRKERFPGAHAIGWVLATLALLLFLGAAALAVWDGVRRGFGFGAFFGRFLGILCAMEVYDIVFFDWVLLCHSNFFPHFYPELKGIDFDRPVIPQLMEWLRERHCQSLLVEGGARTLQTFLDSGCWDAIRVETSPQTVASGTKAPELPGDTRLKEEKHYDGNTIRFYEK